MTKEGKVLAVGAAVLTVGGIVLWFYERSKTTATPAAQVPAGVVNTSDITVTLAGGTQAVTIPVGKTFTIALPSGASWAALVDPNANIVPVSGTGPITVTAISGVYTATWRTSPAAASTVVGGIAVTILAPPSGA